MDNITLICVKDCESAVDPKAPIRDRFTAAARKAKNFWLSTDEEIRFKGAVGAVMLSASEEERTKIENEMRILAMFSAASSGVPVDFTQMEPPEDPIGLVKLWKEASA